jgi:gluconolactonase
MLTHTRIDPAATVPSPSELLPGCPDATVDLQTEAGVALIDGQWRYSDARVEEIDFVEVGHPDDPLGPGLAPNRTFDVLPHAEPEHYDDSDWRILAPEDTQLRLSQGRVCFNWYRIAITIPERVAEFDPTGASVVFEVAIDDYAEVWVNGELPHVIGDAGGPLVGGFNTPSRVVLTDDAQPGQQFQLAVFGINGPISASPRNYIWMRTAALDFYAPERARSAVPAEFHVERADPALDSIVDSGSSLERVAGGFVFTEGPVWSADGSLLFSSPNTNVIYRWHPAGRRLTICQHGNRRVVRVEPHGNVTVLADGFEGRRLNSPNDLVYRSDGTLFFTDPPFGLPATFDDPAKELPFSGVFAVREGRVRLVTDQLEGPNGLAFSPDERYLYVGNWDPERKVVMRYRLGPDDEVLESSVLFDMTGADGEDAIDGLKVDRAGNVYACGPGGVWVISPDGRHLGTLRLPEAPHNLAWGDADARALYITALTSVYRIRLRHPGIRPQ